MLGRLTDPKESEILLGAALERAVAEDLLSAGQRAANNLGAMLESPRRLRGVGGRQRTRARDRTADRRSEDGRVSYPRRRRVVAPAARPLRRGPCHCGRDRSERGLGLADFARRRGRLRARQRRRGTGAARPIHGGPGDGRSPFARRIGFRRRSCCAPRKETPVRGSRAAEQALPESLSRVGAGFFATKLLLRRG